MSTDIANQLTAALKRTPANIVGGSVDLSNLILGLVAGKGVDGLVKAPTGGSKQLNEVFGLNDPGHTGQQVAESLLGMVNPTAAAKSTALAVASVLPLMSGAKAGAKLATGPGTKQAGIIAPARGAEKVLGIESVVDRAMDMFNAGKSQWQIGTESERALSKMRNPGDALSVFIGPDKIPRIKIDSKNARIPQSAPVRVTTELTDRGRMADFASLTKQALAGKDEFLGPAIPLSDFLLHPSLYAISPTASNATVRHNRIFDFFNDSSGGYDKLGNLITIPGSAAGRGATNRDPMGEFLNTLLHESTHIVQEEAKVRGGGRDSIESIRKILNEARTAGSYRSPDQLKSVEKYIDEVDNMPDGPLKDARIQNLYMSNYGEWEARQGSSYGRSLPMMNERGATF